MSQDETEPGQRVRVPSGSACGRLGTPMSETRNVAQRADAIPSDSAPGEERQPISKEELRAILDSHRLWLDTGGSQGSRAELEGRDLSGCSLESANLSKANLQRCNLAENKLQ